VVSFETLVKWLPNYVARSNNGSNCLAVTPVTVLQLNSVHPKLTLDMYGSCGPYLLNDID
jgi:hypothetical protein